MDRTEHKECRKIVEIAQDRLGVEMSLDDAWDVWRRHSNDLEAGFLYVDSEEEVVDVLRRHYKFKPNKI